MEITSIWNLLSPLVQPMNRGGGIHVEPKNQSNKVGHTTKLSDLIKYLHTSAFSPVQYTWISEITNGYFQSLLGLIAEVV